MLKDKEEKKKGGYRRKQAKGRIDEIKNSNRRKVRKWKMRRIGNEKRKQRQKANYVFKTT